MDTEPVFLYMTNTYLSLDKSYLCSPLFGCLYIMYIFLNTQDQEYKYNESHLKLELHSLCVYPYWANKADSDFSVYDLNIK